MLVTPFTISNPEKKYRQESYEYDDPYSLQFLIHRAKEEINKYPYSDKIKIVGNANYNLNFEAKYYFENGESFDFYILQKTYVSFKFYNKYTLFRNTNTQEIFESRNQSDFTYNLNFSDLSLILDFFIGIPNLQKRPGGDVFNIYRDISEDGKIKTKARTKTVENKHPKYNLYKTVKDTIHLREDQLSKLPKNDPNRSTLIQELETAKKTRDQMNKKYKFETWAL